MGIVKAVCSSDIRGVQKNNIDTAHFSPDWGLDGDAHGGNWHRQVSLLSYDKVMAFNKLGAEVGAGAFGENLLVEGIDFRSLPVGSVLKCGEAMFEITQIGKECHNHCQIYNKMGDCIMPREGVFAKVIKEGTVSVGQEMFLFETGEKRKRRAGIITVSDKGSKGEREDRSGAVIKELLENDGYEVVEIKIIPDEQKQIEAELVRFADSRQMDLILTTGGTGFSERDVTPEATLSIAEKIAPGISEAIRANSMLITKRAMLSRAVSVIRGKSLIINLPGSPKAVRESLEFILPELEHGLQILRGETGECGSKA